MNIQSVSNTISESLKIMTNTAIFLEKQLNQAEAEKEKVIKEKLALHLCYSDLQKEYKKLVEENAELRKYANGLGEEIYKAEVSE